VANVAGIWASIHGMIRVPLSDRLTGPYARVRHPQYDGFLLVMIGFLLQWPTIPTLIMFPVLVYVYARLARTEERAVAKRFGREWDEYAARTPAFVPKMGSLGRTGPKILSSQDRHDRMTTATANDTGRQQNITSTPRGEQS
jgi:Phospholipid methyltransferase